MRWGRPLRTATRRRPGVLRQGRPDGGQSLVEFALVLPVLMLIIGAIVQFGLLFWAQNTLNQVLRDAGRWAATQADCSDAAPVIATANAIAGQSSLLGYAAGSWTSSNVTVTWSGTPCPPTSNRDVAWVTINISHTVPTFFPVVPGNGQISSSTQFRVEPAP